MGVPVERGSSHEDTSPVGGLLCPGCYGYYGKRSADAEPAPTAAADPNADPDAWYGHYGYGYRGYGYGGYYRPYGYYGYYGKRSAEPEPTAAAEPKANADPWYGYGYRGYGYGGYYRPHGYYGYYGKVG